MQPRVQFCSYKKPNKLGVLCRFMINFASMTSTETCVESKIKQIVRESSVDRLYFPKFEDLADQLYMSPKTLQRKLRREGICYRQIKDSIRYDFIMENVRNPAIQLKQIAYIAGYWRQSSFSRYFKKRTGMSPRNYRNEVIRLSARKWRVSGNHSLKTEGANLTSF